MPAAFGGSLPPSAGPAIRDGKVPSESDARVPAQSSRLRPHQPGPLIARLRHRPSRMQRIPYRPPNKNQQRQQHRQRHEHEEPQPLRLKIRLSRGQHPPQRRRVDRQSKPQKVQRRQRRNRPVNMNGKYVNVATIAFGNTSWRRSPDELHFQAEFERGPATVRRQHSGPLATRQGETCPVTEREAVRAHRPTE